MNINELKSDLKYLTDKYLAGISRGKPNPRAFKQLVTLLEINEVYLTVKHIHE